MPKPVSFSVQFDDGSTIAFEAKQTPPPPPAPPAPPAPPPSPPAPLPPPNTPALGIFGTPVVGSPIFVESNTDWPEVIGFGDGSSRFNTVKGTTAGHVYDKPGTYRITCGERSQLLTVAPSARRPVYVEDAAALADAFNNPVSDSEYLLRRGRVYPLTAGLSLPKPCGNVVIGAEPGDGPRPIVQWAGGDAWEMLALHKQGRSIVVRDLRFAGEAGGVNLSGTAVAVLRCAFDGTRGAAVNGNGGPAGALVQDCQGLDMGRGGSVWIEGSNWSLLGSRFTNLLMWNVRSGGVDGLTVVGNKLHANANSSLRVEGYRRIYVGQNTMSVDGPRGCFKFGPLPGDDAKKDHADAAGKVYHFDEFGPANRTLFGVAEINKIQGTVTVGHGAEDIIIADNIVDLGTVEGGRCFNIDGYDAAFKRGVHRLYVFRNRLRIPGANGTGIWVTAGGATAVRVVANSVTAPKLVCGDSGTIVRMEGVSPVEVAKEWMFQKNRYDQHAAANAQSWPPDAKGKRDGTFLVNGQWMNDSAWADLTGGLDAFFDSPEEGMIDLPYGGDELAVPVSMS